ncbi:MAG TPA: 6,7-dimethyl-8-ribityllumazine synthase [Pyrinomonadaceae bacterium]|nr:6,7-dimethyl-8-ribityllumazine synthase [Pyrinomonadaceae bacterium]
MCHKELSDLSLRGGLKTIRLVAFAGISYTDVRAFSRRRNLESRNKLQPKIHQGKLKAEGFRYAIIVSRWNEFLTARLVEGALDTLERLGASEDAIEIFKIPGAFEFPLAAKKVATSGRFDAVICVGAVLRGQTPHFDFVAGEATKGITSAALESGIPVVYGIITADTLEQAIDRAGVKAGNKGSEAAMVAVEMANFYRLLSEIGDK